MTFLVPLVDGQSGASSITDLVTSPLWESSINFSFKSLLLLQFLLDPSNFFASETRHKEPPFNKARISKFRLEFLKFDEF